MQIATPHVHAHPRRVISIGLVTTALCAVALTPTPARAVLISDGSVISEYYNDGVSPANFSTTFNNLYNYTNGIQSQGNTVIDPSNPNDQALASATVGGSLAVSILASGTTTNPGTTEAIAETWDTLVIGNYATLSGSVSSDTVIGTLNLTVNQTISTSANATAATAIGLGVFFNNTFLPAVTGSDCGPVVTLACSGLIPGPLLGGSNPATNGGTIALTSGGASRPGTITASPLNARPNPLVYSVPITLGDVAFASGDLSYIAEIGASLTTPDGSVSSVVIDPSITLTGLYPGLSVSTTSGSSYSPVPLPAAAWLFGSGLLGLVVVSGRRRVLPAA